MQTIIETLRAKGMRMTKARSALALVLDADRSPKTVAELVEMISLHEVYPDRTTIYRELETLEALGLVAQHRFDDGITRFQTVSEEHTHHVICTRCKTVEEIELDETSLTVAETLLAKERGFAVEHHSLEFYGTCRNCQ